MLAVFAGATILNGFVLAHTNLVPDFGSAGWGFLVALRADDGIACFPAAVVAWSGVQPGQSTSSHGQMIRQRLGTALNRTH